MQVDSVDWPSKRVFLHADTVTQGFDPIAAHFEIKAIIQANTDNAQNYIAPTAAEGNLPKGGGQFTARYLLVENGWRFVPYDQVGHTIRILSEIVSKEEVTDQDVFDRSGLSVTVDIDSDYSEVEIREVEIIGDSIISAGLSNELIKSVLRINQPSIRMVTESSEEVLKIAAGRQMHFTNPQHSLALNKGAVLKTDCCQ